MLKGEKIVTAHEPHWDFKKKLLLMNKILECVMAYGESPAV
jgi:hypothetical protein